MNKQRVPKQPVPSCPYLPDYRDLHQFTNGYCSGEFWEALYP